MHVHVGVCTLINYQVYALNAPTWRSKPRALILINLICLGLHACVRIITTMSTRALSGELSGSERSVASLLSQQGSRGREIPVEEAELLSRLTSENHDLEDYQDHASHNVLVRCLLWWLSWAMPGLGMFTNAYVLVSVGNLMPLLGIMYPNCYGGQLPPDCNTVAADSTQTIETAGVIGGMLVIGFMADWMGRKWGSRLCTSIMLVGLTLVLSASGTASQFLIVYLTGLCVFGVGVGGEYPMASSSAAERAEGTAEIRHKRGRTVLLVFSQQGWGNFSNVLVIIIVMAMTGATGSTISKHQANIVYRVQFSVGGFILLLLMAYRIKYLKESKVWQQERKGVDRELNLEGEANNASKLYFVIFRKFWPRLIATCLSWTMSDLIFYGNKLFQSQFIELISGSNSTLFKQMQWNLLNAFVALIGYFCAALLIDNPYYGRRRMQFVGFLMTFLLFLMQAIFYSDLIKDGNISAFQALYFLSSFFMQFGANCTTFLVAAEVFPTDVRAFFHGVSAASGRTGTLIATQVFPRISSQGTFYVAAGAGITGAVLTLLFLPDTTALNISEIDRLNRYLVAGRVEKYHGEAVNPKFLSLYEILMGWHRAYDAIEDSAQKNLQEASKRLAELDMAHSDECLGQNSGVLNSPNKK